MTMSKLEFKPEDFPQDRDLGAEEHAERANFMFNIWLESQEEVYGHFGINNHNEITHQDRNPTHRAKLVCIEEVEKKPCEHSPTIFHLTGDPVFIISPTEPQKCRYCGVKLKAEWKAVE